jgi:hypothetical protein
MFGKKFFITTAVFSLLFFALGGWFLWAHPAVAQQAAPIDFGVNQAGAIGLPATDVRVVVANIIRVALGLLGIVSTVLIVYAGFIWMTAGGEEEKISQAKKILVNSAIGLAIIISAYSITSFIITQLVGAVNGGAGTGGSSTTGCTGPDCGAGSGYSGTANVFYVSSLPSAGNTCVANAHLAVVFNKDVDLATLQSNVIVQKKASATAVPGSWQYGDVKSIAFFVPQGDCGSGVTTNDCYEPSTNYQLQFKNTSAIKSLDNLTLNCALKAGCGNVDFTSGTGVERNTPRITITSPASGSSAPLGSVIPVSVAYTSDSGIQNVSLYQNGGVIAGQPVTGCAATGTVSLSWSTIGLNAGTYTLQAIGSGWSGKQGVDTTTVKLAPLHCFDANLDTNLGEIQKGPPACGGECGSCAGDRCSDNSQCSSGYCDLTSGAGFCVDRMRITGISPPSGAPGTYVSLAGVYFGTTPGSVYFSKVANPNPAKLTDWVKADLVACVAGVSSWTTSQILVEAPNGAVNGPIMVVTAPTTGKDGVTRTFTDLTNDTWGPALVDFQITNQVHPGLCSLNPVSGVSGDSVQIFGKNFGFLDSSNDSVTFGDANSAVNPLDWTDQVIKTSVPGLSPSVVGVKVKSNGVESNSLRFVVGGGVSSEDPIISSASPNTGAPGEYITITGKNFGSNVGSVWFKASSQSEAILGNFTFPAACQGTVWRDDQIIVKFPQNKGATNTTYYIQVNTANNKVSSFENAPTFILQSGTPNPGVCKISPVSGPVPFPTNQTVTIFGEYFGTNPQIYFWKTGANPIAVDGRVAVPSASIVKNSDTSVELNPPVSFDTGPVILMRGSDKRLSNPVQFSTVNCVKNNNTCSVQGSLCCSVGPEAGTCKPAGELCEGALRSTGYIWRFSTNDIPEVPHVVERCDASVDTAQSLPSPSPSVQWSRGGANDDQVNVCRTALVTVEFSTALDQSTVNGANITLNKCSSVSGTTCVNPVVVAVTPDSYTLQTATAGPGGTLRNYVSLAPSAGKLEDATWYQVSLSKAITSQPIEGKSLPLASDRSCSSGSAYCFVFKSGAQDCKIKAVVITPYSYWTSVLEAPMKYHAGTFEKDLNYVGNGLSDQRCILMNVSDFTWSWGTGDKSYAVIYGQALSRSVQASALANTVGVGLSNPDDAVNINATARRGADAYAGTSPLTIDLNNPEVVDYWPKCQEACTVAEVGVKFNTTMSNRNLPGAMQGGTVQLLKCLDENCLSTQPVLQTSDVYLDSQSGYSLLKIANSRLNSIALQINTVYQVIVSASSTNPQAATNEIWSAARLNNPDSFSRPYTSAFTWRFKTKKDSCQIDHVEVNPSVYVAQSVKERATYQVQPYSSPDSCSPKGQKLNPWTVGWSWTSSDQNVATINTYSTQGASPSCTSMCTRKGSDLPASVSTAPVCGNGIIEAGEDCDQPDKAKGCGLGCRFTGNTAASCGDGVVDPTKGEACDPKDPKTQIGCSSDCRHQGAATQVSALNVTASICGSGTMGSGKDCDIKIASSVKDPNSALLCSEQCLHLGTALSSKWCYDNRLTKGGFTASEYDTACGKSLSQCGNGLQEPEEDPGCDTASGWNSAECNQFCLKKNDTQCVPNTEGCDSQGRLLGSSLSYTQPSVCGDGVTGVGEVAFCESSLISNNRGNLIDPWALAIGRGLGTPSGQPPTQITTITAGTNQNTKSGTVSGKGTFGVACGFSTDQECQDTFGSDYGVGSNSCCTLRPKLVSTYPANATTNACPNTYLEAVFDSQIDPGTLKNGIIIARGAVDCGTGQDVTAQVAYTGGSLVVSPWYLRLENSIAQAFRRLWSDEAQAVSPRWCVAPDVGVAEVNLAPEIGPNASRLVVKLSQPLALNADYAVILKNTIKTVGGTAVSGVAGKPVSWVFSTVAQLCLLNSVQVQPAQWSFSRVGASTTLFAKASTNSGLLIQGIPGVYDWNYLWTPLGNPSVFVVPTTSSANAISAQNRNGEVDVYASAQITANTLTAATGTVAIGKSHVIVLLCENPWPPKDLYLGGKGPITIFPFEDKIGNNDGFDVASNTFNNTPTPPSPVTTDGYFNFSTYYCADRGVPGTFDDLPYLRGTVQVAPSVVSATTSLKRFLFTNTSNNDVVGLQVFPNPKHLTAQEWYAADRASGGQGFVGTVQNVDVNGFSAVSDGSNVYVDGLNYSSGSKGLYSNIYLLSVNSNAKPETRSVFDQILKNFKITTNLTNFRYCAPASGVPDFKTACSIDFDCPSGQTCSATVDKLKRNYQRLRDLKNIQTALGNFSQATGAFPTVAQGTYLSGQTISTWPSWSDFGTSIGASLPADPVNLLGKGGTCSKSTNVFCDTNAACPSAETCVIHDPLTGWSTTDRRFSFACATSSLAYRYTVVSSTNYTLRAHLEDPSISISNRDSFIRDFVDTNRVITTDASGICNQDQEISTINQGRCGDGVINYVRNEECDPPGFTRYGSCGSTLANKVQVEVCSSDCKYVPSSTPYLACSALSNCGNGKVEVGEQCDEGVLNGTYNHCSKICTWPPTNPPGYCGDGVAQPAFERCDYKAGLGGKIGICVGGTATMPAGTALAFPPCNTNADCGTAGVCQPVTPATGRYSTSSASSCSSDCKAAGTWCGDGIAQPEFGEECDGDLQCTVNGQPGKKVCLPTCKLVDNKPIAWWSLDNFVTTTLTNGTLSGDFPVLFSKGNGVTSPFVCDNKGSFPFFCPEIVAGKRSGALSFDGSTEAAVLSGKQASSAEKNLLFNGLASSFSVEAWINPGARLPWARVVEKSGFGKDGGFTFQLDNAGEKISLVVWNKDSKASFGATGTTTVPLNQWTHVVGTYQRQGTVYTVKVYVNGQLDGSSTKDTPEEVFYPGDQADDSYLVIGRQTFENQSGTGGWFKGQLDELKIYSSTLSPSEIAERAASFSPCIPTTILAVSTISSLPTCGDGKVDPGEACDRGSTLNGLACTPTYGKSCSYCSKDCRNVIDVQPQQYCGDAKINGPEVCENDAATGLAYSAGQSSGAADIIKDPIHNGYPVLACESEPTDKGTVKKGGPKVCASTCSVIQSSCVTCGIDETSGVVVKGEMINVLTGATTDPLLATVGDGSFHNSIIQLGLATSTVLNPVTRVWEVPNLVAHVGWQGKATPNAFTLHPASEDAVTSLTNAKISSDSRCSYGNEPNYLMSINYDNNPSSSFRFPVVANPKPWQYDLVLSPVINQVGNQVNTPLRGIRGNDIRIVAKWVGVGSTFVGGFLFDTSTPIVDKKETADYPLDQKYDYWTETSLGGGIWSHGLQSTTGGTNVFAFTVDSSLAYNHRIFYVRLPQADKTLPGILRYAATTKLEVDVYFPEWNEGRFRSFSQPKRTFSLDRALASDNPSAAYWEVFDINSDPSIVNAEDRIVPIGKIVTQP